MGIRFYEQILPACVFVCVDSYCLPTFVPTSIQWLLCDYGCGGRAWSRPKHLLMELPMTYTILYYTILYYTTLHYTTIYHTILWFTIYFKGHFEVNISNGSGTWDPQFEWLLMELPMTVVSETTAVKLQSLSTELACPDWNDLNPARTNLSFWTTWKCESWARLSFGCLDNGNWAWLKLQCVQPWEERFYTPPPPGSDFWDCDCVELRQKPLCTTPSGWWWRIESVFRSLLALRISQNGNRACPSLPLMAGSSAVRWHAASIRRVQTTRKAVLGRG